MIRMDERGNLLGMETNVMQSQVRQFMEKMRQHIAQISDSPGIPPAEVATLRYRLINEEAGELCKAITDNDLPQVVDGMCDLLYVVFGTATAYGIDLQKYFDEVHMSNMLKDPAVVDRYGKVIKPPLWQPPRIKEMLAEEIARKELS